MWCDDSKSNIFLSKRSEVLIVGLTLCVSLNSDVLGDAALTDEAVVSDASISGCMKNTATD